MKELRDYQRDAVASVYNHLRTRDDNPCVVIPTGGGKTPVLAQICMDAVNWSGRVLVLAHVKELLEQSVRHLHDADQTLIAKVGVYSAGLGKREIGHPITVAGIQSVYEKATKLGKLDLIIVDEAHLIPIEGDGMYRTFLKDAKLVNPNVRVIGLTATPYRMKEGMICAPENILNHVCHETGVRELIARGFLCNLKSKAGSTHVDTDGLHIRAGEFVQAEIEQLMGTEELASAACADIVRACEVAGRNHVLVFAASVEHGGLVATKLRALTGQSVGEVYGDTPSDERAALVRDFREGKLKFLVNMNVLTIGFDAPNVDMIALLRPTASPGLYYQMVGRGFRIHPGKEHCIAEGQRVLTDSGLVPIEQVTRAMKVWDGVDFVAHDGIALRGQQEVISYAGITATQDHKVWTKDGWRTLGECKRAKIAIAVTGHGRKAVRLSYLDFRTNSLGGRKAPRDGSNKVPDVRCENMATLRQRDSVRGGVSEVRTQEEQKQARLGRAEVAALQVHCGEATLHEYPRCGVRGLRLARGGEQAQLKVAPKTARVFDIINAGPFNRFTCEGLLVSNCLILDYGNNVLRHGPVDLLKPEKRAGTEGGEAPAKECPKCQSLIHAAYRVCPECGFEFPPPEKKHRATHGQDAVLSGEAVVNELEVEEVFYQVHRKKGAEEGAPRTMRVTYKPPGLNADMISEWVCIEHQDGTFPLRKAHQWWRARSNVVMPRNAEEAVEIAQEGGLAKAKRIKVQYVPGDKFPRIVSVELEEIPKDFVPWAAKAADAREAEIEESYKLADAEEPPF